MFKIYSKTDNHSNEVRTKVSDFLKSNGYIISNEKYKFVITIGGDGTFIDAISNEINNLDDLIFIPINTGHLGFYTERYEDFETIISRLYEGNCDSYKLLEAHTNGRVYYALNEFSVLSNSKTLVFDYFIDGEHLQSLRGSGVIVSTSQGSTAMAKSYNGAVIYPNSDAFQISEVSSINNSLFRTLNSSIILPASSEFKLRICDKEYASFNYDTTYNMKFDDEITFKLGDKKVMVKHLQKSTFTKRIKDGFIK